MPSKHSDFIYSETINKFLEAVSSATVYNQLSSLNQFCS